MGNAIFQSESGTQQRGGLSAGLWIVVSLLNWLAGFIQLTEEEQENAGIYLGNLGNQRHQ